MNTELANKITDALAQDLTKFKFSERHNNITDNIVGVVKKPKNPIRIGLGLGGHGISAVVTVPNSIVDQSGMKNFFQTIRNDINSKFVGAAAYKSAHSFIVLVCSHKLYTNCMGIASELKDKSGLHKNIIQGVILIDAETKDISGDYTRPAQNKREYDTVLSAATRALR